MFLVMSWHVLSIVSITHTDLDNHSIKGHSPCAWLIDLGDGGQWRDLLVSLRSTRPFWCMHSRWFFNMSTDRQVFQLQHLQYWSKDSSVFFSLLWYRTITGLICSVCERLLKHSSKHSGPRPFRYYAMRRIWQIKRRFPFVWPGHRQKV